MKAINKSLESELKVAVVKSLENYQLADAGGSLSDLYIYYDVENQMLNFFDDTENPLYSVNLTDKNILLDDDSLKEVRFAAKFVLKELEKEHVFEKKFICKPFSVNLIDADFIVTDELIFIDDDTLKLEGDFWGHVEKELNTFLKGLIQ
ncbi:MAG: hypothetical protein FWF52_11320 [Candidatus Azobacteroides sp.]|nr:hypothetical protein [Candidatus Azobacteroides sp.]